MIQRTLIFFVMLGILLPCTTFASGFGVSPARITLTNILNDTEITRTFFLSRDPATDPLVIHAAITGPAAHAVRAPSDIVIPQGAATAPYTFTIAPLGLAMNTEHRVQFFFSPDVPRHDNTASALIPRIEVELVFTVTSSLQKSFTITQALLKTTDKEDVKSLHGFSFHIVNTGNVPVRPTAIVISVTKRTPSKDLSTTHTIDESDIPLVDPFSERDVVIPFTPRLPSGQYGVDIVFSNNAAVVYEEKNIPLQIQRPKNNALIIELLIGCIGLGAILLIVHHKTKK